MPPPATATALGGGGGGGASSVGTVVDVADEEKEIERWSGAAAAVPGDSGAVDKDEEERENEPGGAVMVAHTLRCADGSNCRSVITAVTSSPSSSSSSPSSSSVVQKVITSRPRSTPPSSHSHAQPPTTPPGPQPEVPAEPHVTCDVMERCRGAPAKRKSLESVIRSLRPTRVAVTSSHRPEVARPSRPEVLVRPMHRPNQNPALSNQLPVSVSPAGCQLTGAVDLRRPKQQQQQQRPLAAATGAGNGAAVRRRVQTTPPVGDELYSSKRRRPSWPPSHARPSPAAACVYTMPYRAGPDVTSFPEPNGYDAPLELTTPRSRDRK